MTSFEPGAFRRASVTAWPILLAPSYGLNVIGSRSANNDLNAMLAAWVMQIAFEPRMVAVSLENDALTLRHIEATSVFTVNPLNDVHGIEIAKKVVMPAEGDKIAGRSTKAGSAIHHKLSELRYRLSDTGCPILLDALGWYSCRAEQFIPAGDHTVVFGQVLAGEILSGGEMLLERDIGWEYGG
jgi:flavin reductase (DIM6/NTAB) family NADH-FMN oxidoreductase RutF